MDTDKKLQILADRLRYIQDILGHRENDHTRLLASELAEIQTLERNWTQERRIKALETLEELFEFSEKQLEQALTPMDRVRIVRHPQRICLKDILENVYDNYTEIGGQDEYSIDPSIVIARAYITRRSRGKAVHQPVMVIGQEKGHGQEFRNGGSVKPWGNAKALHYMKVAETENIPIHTYVFTPGAYPIEDYPGAAQQIAKNLYEMSALKVPVVAVFSEGGSGGAEAIALADMRLMLSHGYYSVISPEGGAAIEGRLRDGQRATPELIEACAKNLKITADDNVRFGYIDRIIQEPPLGARPEHYDFFKMLRQEVVAATDEVYLKFKGIKFFRAMGVRRMERRRKQGSYTAENFYVRWALNTGAKEDLLARRYARHARMSRWASRDTRPAKQKFMAGVQDVGWSVYSFFKYDFLRKHQKVVVHTLEEVGAEVQYVVGKLLSPWRAIRAMFNSKPGLNHGKAKELTELSYWEDPAAGSGWRWVSPKAKEDKAITCPNAVSHGCLDLWAPDLYGDQAGVCSYCGHHFPMEPQWFVNNICDPGSIYEFNAEIEAGNPLGYPGLDAKLDEAKKRTGMKSGCRTFEARIDNTRVVVAMLTGTFRGGSVGAAEGEKFFQAAERALKKRFPFIAYVHGTAGIRIQEGTNGVIQMPRCTMAVRRYIDAGGLYMVIYDTNSYAGPVASFLGCSPYQFSVRSANIGFAGPGVIKETTGLDIPPDYHRAYRALSRGHIQGIWDRRELRGNCIQALLTMGGRNLYYR
ncbi:acetyl-CoA carboxylase carboxyl transferase subunit alpha/beta [Megalodesulfovibrio paquesii]